MTHKEAIEMDRELRAHSAKYIQTLRELKKASVITHEVFKTEKLRSGRGISKFIESVLDSHGYYIGDSDMICKN